MKSVLVTRVTVCTDISGAHPACVKKYAEIKDFSYIPASEIPSDAKVRTDTPWRVIYNVEYDRRISLLIDKELIPLENE